MTSCIFSKEDTSPAIAADTKPHSLHLQMVMHLTITKVLFELMMAGKEAQNFFLILLT